VLAAQFQIPPRGKLDRALVVGSLLFGIGWGLGGYCPGPALMATMTGASSALTFFVSMLAGIGIFKLTAILKTRRL
jgi:uncharacterized membrane protein YedE/YeeE